LKFQESTGTPFPKVGVALRKWVFTPSHSLTLSYILESMWCDSWASSWPAPLRPLSLDSRASSWPVTLQPFCLGREPKARVATHIIWLWATHLLICLIEFFFGTWKVLWCSWNKWIFFWKILMTIIWDIWWNMNFFYEVFHLFDW
jgi:hypothetical protein